MNDLAFEAQKEAEAKRQGEAVEQIVSSIECAEDRNQFINDLTDLMRQGKLDVTKCNGV